jgi:xylitol oxidase
MQNWAENLTYSAQELCLPASLEELCAQVAGADVVKALGSRHSFNDVADTHGRHVSLERMPPDVLVDPASMSVTSSAGLTHAQLSAELEQQGLALPNLASLPHLTIGGAIQTGTHGSGTRNPVLSAGVTAFDIVDANGQVRRLTDRDPDFDAVVVGLGAFGIVHSVTQDVVAAFDVEQRVFEGVSWEILLPVLEDVMASADSVSLFTRFDQPAVPQIWVKRRVMDGAGLDLTSLGGVEALVPLHPLPDTPADNVTEQLGKPGPSRHRLPHFRHDFKPGRGDEIQSEYFVDVRQAVEAIEAVRSLGPQVAPLLHVAEIRRVASDTAWLSPARERESLALHFTWRRQPREVSAFLPILESALLPLGARPHWGKVFACDHEALVAAYPKLPDFAALVSTYDPEGRFGNDFLRRVLSAGRAPASQPLPPRI